MKESLLFDSDKINENFIKPNSELNKSSAAVVFSMTFSRII